MGFVNSSLDLLHVTVQANMTRLDDTSRHWLLSGAHRSTVSIGSLRVLAELLAPCFRGFSLLIGHRKSYVLVMH